MQEVLAFGDSNTWGLIPGTLPYERYPWDKRWTGRLSQGGYHIIEEGLCGRTTVFEDALRPGRRGVSSLPLILESHTPVDAAIIMLGTNDCKTVYGAASHIIGLGLEACLQELEKYLPADRVLVVSPVLLGEQVWQPDKDPEFGKQSVETSRELKEVYRRIAAQRGNRFLAAEDVARVSSQDEEHMDEKGHRLLAAAVWGKLQEMFAAVA